jgi:hypothetical protein
MKLGRSNGSSKTEIPSRGCIDSHVSRCEESINRNGMLTKSYFGAAGQSVMLAARLSPDHITFWIQHQNCVVDHTLGS